MPIPTVQKYLLIGLFVLTFLYIIFPVDLIPDTVGIAGYIDDAFAVIIIAVVALGIFNSIRTNIIQNWNQP